jgi:2'-deoxynucleoside 5'-phosphate N-hydrolase
LLRPRSPEVQSRKGKADRTQGAHHQIGINSGLISPGRLKVYLSVPMIANRALERAQLMAKAIADSGHELSSPWVLGPVERGDRVVVDVFKRDTTAAEGSDLLVADVSEPSIGVGMEIMAAHSTGRKVILVAKKGEVTSWMLKHMDNKETIEYSDEDEIYAGLKRLLSR